MMNHRMPSDPHLRRWMMFVDGENFTIRGQQFCSKNNISLSGDKYWKKNIYMWMPGPKANELFFNSDEANLGLQYLGERAFYYTSLTGSLEDKNSVEESLHNLGFNPKVFLKTRQEEKSKGVDVHLTTDILSNAYLNNYDVALIVTGDADFIPAIEEVKRLGKIVYVCFFTGKENGLSPRLSLTSDKNINITGLFEKVWREWKSS
ncbi:MAG: NYN domain-containing protein [Candidatus Sedimenticola sp. (ex Thyasira tokunagai)]